MLATEISWQIHWILLKIPEIWHFVAVSHVGWAVMATVGITCPLLTPKSINLFLKEGGHRIYLYFPTAQFRWTYCVLPSEDLVFLHATHDVSLHHSYAMSQRGSGTPGVLRKMPWSNHPQPLHKHQNLAGLDHSHWWKNTLRSWETSAPRPNTLLPWSNFS